MNICKLTNKLNKYNLESLGCGCNHYPKSEVSLFMFLWELVIAISVTISFNWFVYPLRKIKFKCDKV